MSSLVGRAVEAVSRTMGTLSSRISNLMSPSRRSAPAVPDGTPAPHAADTGKAVSRKKSATGRKRMKKKTAGSKKKKQPPPEPVTQVKQQPGAKKRKTMTKTAKVTAPEAEASQSTGVRTRSMIRMSAKQLYDLPDEIISMILSQLSIREKTTVSRVSHKFQDLVKDQLRRQTVIGIIACPHSRDEETGVCDSLDHSISADDLITSKQLVKLSARRLCLLMPQLRVIKFDDLIDGRTEMQQAEILLKRSRETITCFQFPALVLRSHNMLCKNLIHLSIHSMCMDTKSGSGSSRGTKAAGSILKSIKVLKCKEMCPKVFKRLPCGLISLKTDTHGRNFINFLLKSPATATMEIMKVTNFYSQSIDPFSIPRLKYLSIQGYFVHDTSTQFLRSLAASQELTHLKLQFFTEIRQNQFPQFIKISADEWVKFISKLKCIQSLEIWASLVNDAVVKCICDRLAASLKSIILHWSCLTDSGLAHLSDLSQLTTCKVMSEDNEISADAIIEFVEKQRVHNSLTQLSIKTKSSLSGQDERLITCLNQAQNSSSMKQIQVCCIRQQQTYRLF